MMTYDPIFIPAGYQTCLSTWAMKDIVKINHRGIAIQELVKNLEKIL
jgi:inosine/xanthosine triphosphate pyrophosphatase family protein